MRVICTINVVLSYILFVCLTSAHAAPLQDTTLFPMPPDDLQHITHRSVDFVPAMRPKSSVGCRRLRLLGVPIRKCSNHMVGNWPCSLYTGSQVAVSDVLVNHQFPIDLWVCPCWQAGGLLVLYPHRLLHPITAENLTLFTLTLLCNLYDCVHGNTPSLFPSFPDSAVRINIEVGHLPVSDDCHTSVTPLVAEIVAAWAHTRAFVIR